MKRRSVETDTKTTYRSGVYRYAVGFGFALLIMYTMYFAATGQWLESTGLAALLLGLAAVQFGLQMVVFLHIYDEKGTRWTLWSIIYTIVMLLIVVIASLWIMANMNYNMHMTPEQMNEFMLEQNEKGF